MSKFIIYADEAWTHNSYPLNRYHNFFGGIFGEERYISSLSSRLNNIIQSSGLSKIEVKWSNLDPINIELYKLLVDCLCAEIMSGRVRYRQMFSDRSYVYAGPNIYTDLDIQFLQYYQFLKHSFGFKYLKKSSDHEINLFLDTHSSHKHTKSLENYIYKLTTSDFLERNDIEFKIIYINSNRHICLQVCDVIMGAAGYYGNKHYLRKINGQKRKTKKQILKLDMCKYIYKHLSNINKLDRKSNSFNWFESTGINGDQKNYFKHKMRIWKFIPYPHQKNKGWEKDHLNKDGTFIADDIDPKVFQNSFDLDKKF